MQDQYTRLHKLAEQSNIASALRQAAINHYPGYYQAVQGVHAMTLPQMLETCKALYGLNHIEDQTDIEEVRAETLRQVEMDWREVTL